MSGPLDADAYESPASPRHQLVLVDGRTFAISDESGRMWAPTHGLVHDDLRHVSRLAVSIDGSEVELLASTAPTPLSAVIVSRFDAGHGSRPAGVMSVRRWVAGGLRQDIHLQNPSGAERLWRLRVEVTADFAHVFDVKAGRPAPERTAEPVGSGWEITRPADAGINRASRSDPSPDRVDPDGALVWDLRVPAREERTVCLTIEPVSDGAPAGLAFPCEVAPADAVPLRRLDRWQARVPTVVSNDPRLSVVVDQALADLAGLRIFDRAQPERVVIAAGAPWFMTLFGRDSLLTAWMTLPFDGSLARGVLRTLAELQGTVDDPTTEEQPGKILHELRRHGAADPSSSERYFGHRRCHAAVRHAAEAWRWALSDADLSDIAPAVDHAVTWILGDGDSNGDGFLDYWRHGPEGLSNQGWKDSWDGITIADGSLHGSDRAGRGPGLRLRRPRRGGGPRRTRLPAPRPRRAPGPGGRAAQPLRGPVLGRAWLVRAGPRRRGPARRLAHHEPRAHALVRHRRPHAGRSLPRPADGRRPVDRLGPSHPGHHDGRLRPPELPQRVGVASRHGDLRGGRPRSTGWVVERA